MADHLSLDNQLVCTSKGRMASPASEVHDVFNNRDLPSVSRATKSNSNKLYFGDGGVSCIAPSMKSKEGFSGLVLGFLLGDIWLLGGGSSLK